MERALTRRPCGAIPDCQLHSVDLAAPGVAFPGRAEIRNAAGDVLATYDEFTDLGKLADWTGTFR